MFLFIHILIYNQDCRAKARMHNIRLTWEAELARFVRKRAAASSTNRDKPLTQVEAIVIYFLFVN